MQAFQQVKKLPDPSQRKLHRMLKNIHSGEPKTNSEKNLKVENIYEQMNWSGVIFWIEV